MYNFERILSAVFGMAAFSLNPAAGAHAELAALLIAKAYFKKKGEGEQRTTFRARYGAWDESSVGCDGRV